VRRLASDRFAQRHRKEGKPRSTPRPWWGRSYLASPGRLDLAPPGAGSALLW